MSQELKLRGAGAPTLQPGIDRGASDRIVRPPRIAACIMLNPSGELDQ